MSPDIYPSALIVAILLAAYGLRKRSLSTSGSITALLVGYLTLANPLKLFGISLLVFYFAGSRATKVKAKVKSELDEGAADALTGGNRNGFQVLCNSLIGTVSALLWRSYYEDAFRVPEGRRDWCVIERSEGDGNMSRALIFIGVAFWSVCAGDTLSSELGILSSQPPLLITTLRPVPKGTNGGVSSLGLLSSLLGGLLIGFTATISLLIQNPICGWERAAHLVLVGAGSGVLGSLLDSLLGATLQQTLYSKTRKMVVNSYSKKVEGEEIVKVCGVDLLSNNQVNILSSTTVSLIVGSLAMLYSL
ncbi:hypothetical protein BT69DRAFT_1261722 [Atractiella rhizophila]|nr:hypothetical protein BT69DRAFT_1261722 [Atractiella rhizophila]